MTLLFLVKKVYLKCCNTPFIDIGNILNSLEQGVVDYNDQIIAELCIQNNFKLVTHDGDFASFSKNKGLNIITGNLRFK